MVPILKKGISVNFKRRPIEIRGKKALIYGYGGIGQLLAEKLKSFGLDVSAVNGNYVPIDSNISKYFGLVAVGLAAVNIFGGFVVTNRMLSMFKKKQ